MFWAQGGGRWPGRRLTGADRTREWNKLSVASSDVERAEMRSKPYLAFVGSLLWATLTHPETTYYVAFLCQFMHDPSPDAYEAALGVLAYLVGVRDMGITYDRSDDPAPTVYSDSSWGQVPKPFGGWVVMAYNGAVSFAARKLKIVPISTAEAETAVYSAACRDLRYISSIMGEDGFQLQKKMKMPVTVYCDNDSAVSTMKNLGSTARTRHFDSLSAGRSTDVSNSSSCSLSRAGSLPSTKLGISSLNLSLKIPSVAFAPFC